MRGVRSAIESIVASSAGTVIPTGHAYWQILNNVFGSTTPGTWSSWVSLGTVATDQLIGECVMAYGSGLTMGYAQFAYGPSGSRVVSGTMPCSTLSMGVADPDALMAPILIPGGQEGWCRVVASNTNVQNIQYFAQPVLRQNVARRSYGDPLAVTTDLSLTAGISPSWGSDRIVMNSGVLPEPCYMRGLVAATNAHALYGARFRAKVNDVVVYDGSVAGTGAPWTRGKNLPWEIIVPTGAEVKVSATSTAGGGGGGGAAVIMTVALPGFEALR